MSCSIHWQVCVQHIKVKDTWVLAMLVLGCSFLTQGWDCA